MEDGTSFLTISDHPVSYGINEWHHVAVSVQPGQYELYFDGQSQGTTSMSAGTPVLIDADHDLAIGAIGAFLFPDGEDFHGWIDDVQIYDTALTGDEIRFAMQNAPEPASAVIWALGGLALATSRSWRIGGADVPDPTAMFQPCKDRTLLDALAPGVDLPTPCLAISTYGNVGHNQFRHAVCRQGRQVSKVGLG